MLLTFSFYTSFGRRLTSPKRNVSSSWRCLLQIFLGCSKRSNYRVSTPFVFLRDSSVTIMRCGPNLTQASGKQSYLTAIQVITGHQSHVTSLWWFHSFFSTTVRYRRLINPKQSVAEYTLSIIKKNKKLSLYVANKGLLPSSVSLYGFFESPTWFWKSIVDY